MIPSSGLPPLDDEGELILAPEAILDSRERHFRRRFIRECLVKWTNLPAEDATWESDNILKHPTLSLLEDKQIQGGRIVMSPL